VPVGPDHDDVLVVPVLIVVPVLAAMFVADKDDIADPITACAGEARTPAETEPSGMATPKVRPNNRAAARVGPKRRCDDLPSCVAFILSYPMVFLGLDADRFARLD
jgi:hypothetical protein